MLIRKKDKASFLVQEVFITSGIIAEESIIAFFSQIIVQILILNIF